MFVLKVKFTNSGDIIYAVALEQETDNGENYELAFKTFDASDYSSIGKIYLLIYFQMEMIRFIIIPRPDKANFITRAYQMIVNHI